MRSERLRRRTFHTPRRRWQQKATAAILWAGKSRLCESHGAMARPAVGKKCWVWGWKPESTGWMVRREGPGAAWSVPQLLRVSMKAIKPTLQTPEHPGNEPHPWSDSSSFSGEKRGALFQCSQWEAIQLYMGSHLYWYLWPSASPFPWELNPSSVASHPHLSSYLFTPWLYWLLCCCVGFFVCFL